jgi:hypothetical protein
MATIDKFSGLRNQQRPERLQPGSLVDAENVILDDTGALETRPGFSGIIGLLDIGTITDSYPMPHNQYGYVLANGSIYCWDGQSLRTAATGLSDSKLQFAALSNHLLYAGDNDAGWIRNGIHWQPIRVPMPTPPRVEIRTGSLYAGQYQITQVYRHLVTGITSPAHPSMSVDCIEQGLSSVAIFPNAPSGWVSDIYITERNSTVERYLATSYGGQVIYDGQPLGDALDDWHINTQPLPDLPISGLALSDLRLHAAIYNSNFDTTQYFRSIQGHWHLFRLNREVFSRGGRCQQMLGVAEGVLIATDREVILWSENGTDEGAVTRLAAYGCGREKPIMTDSFGAVTINTDRGLATYPPFDNSGRLKYIPPKAESSRSAIVHQDGKHIALVNADETHDAYTQYDQT